MGDVESVLNILEMDADYKETVADKEESKGNLEKAKLLRAEAKGIFEAVKEVRNVL